ncbi:hypothetical protein B0H14DRAFT_2865967 [Mycena olivaceomarginata]|nr:hypothetical protein B0H14DRAFT_2865967 [Mycena olivaceomarginata]
MLSETSCWMPSDFTVGEDGSVKLVSPYINNLHPTQHRNIYPVVEEIISRFVPLWERVLDEINRENGREPFVNSGRLGEISCVSGAKGEPWPKKLPYDEEESEEFLNEFFGKAKKTLPEANSYTGEAQFSPLSLPPQYHGGGWHIEGMVNEHIIASGIYYYDEQNIEETSLSFRVPTGEPGYHDQGDSRCVQILYGIALDSSTNSSKCIQDLGSVEGRPRLAKLVPALHISIQTVGFIQTRTPQDPGHLPR